ncbi:lipoprotein insertase outer membrane protein LolB [Planctobacterium marinum]|uniref:lipoprotein insertase outer membrane protein LolB n=2 Tax=Planctobacterium marinum TaxID=1631968 RepID=UPI003608091D
MHKILVILSILLLSACATRPEIRFQDASVAGKFPQHWTIDGRIAFKSPEEKFSASMTWEQDDQDYLLRLSKLIGGTLLTMQKTGERVLLEVDDNTFTDSNATRLIYQNTGWNIPVDDLKYWISGRLNQAGASVKAVQRDENGRLWSFTSQDGWRVKYQNYKVFSGTALPHNILLSHNKLQLKIRISEWHFKG